jgi:hypothetical protein
LTSVTLDEEQFDLASMQHVLVLEAGRAEWRYRRDIWVYRELFVILAWRDVAVRYKQTVVGVAWASLGAIRNDGRHQMAANCLSAPICGRWRADRGHAEAAQR